VFALRPTGTSQRNAADEDERASKSGCRSDAGITPPKAGVVDLDAERLWIGSAVRLAKCRAGVSDRTERGGCNRGDRPDGRQNDQVHINVQVHPDTLSSSG
jgi:hypothetical protein